MRRTAVFQTPVRFAAVRLAAVNIDTFAIGFDHRDRERLHALWDEAIDNEQWSDGPLTHAFEAAWAGWNGLPALSTSSWTGAALAAFEFFELRGRTVLCPSNTFMATPLALLAAGADVQFVDCNRDDLCMSFEDLSARPACTSRAPPCSFTSEATSPSRSSRSPRTAATRGSS